MDHVVEARVAIYANFAATGVRPSVDDLATRLRTDASAVRDAFQVLRAQRVLLLEADGESIRMAPPFSGVPTQHRVSSAGVIYHANCAWDALGIPAALRRHATVHSRCEQTLEPLELDVPVGGPAPSDWLFHCVVPAARWWDDLVFT